MTDKRRIDVFISSTSKDLEDYRKAVQNAILNLGLSPIGMENWPATGEPPVDLVREKVNNAEIYVGIYAHRYGWQPDGYDGKSITELEFDWAGEVVKDGKKIPRLCFIVKDDHAWPTTFIEYDKKKELDAFKARVKDFHCGFFTTPDNLQAQVTAALAEAVKKYYNLTVTPYKCVTAPRPEHFAGRVDIMRDLIARLSTTERVAVTAVRAIGGMGKTTLAKELAHRVEGKFGIVLWAEVGELWSEEKEKAILRGWARDLAGVEFAPEWDAAQLAVAVRPVIEKAARDGCGEPILVILDDVWPTTLDAAKRLRAAAPAASRALITTRQKETAIDLDVLEGAILSLQQMSPDEGAEMMQKLIGDKADLALLRTLSETLGGHPLSLRLAARRARKTSDLAGYVRTVQDALRRGEAFSTLKLDAGSTKEESVSVTLEISYKALPEERQAQFRMLGVLPLDLSVSRENLYALWGSEDLAILDEFLLDGLLEDAPDQPGRYQQHRLLRSYARALGTPEEHATAERRHWEYIVNFAYNGFRQPPETWNEFAAEFPLITAVGDELVSRVTGTDDPDKQEAALNDGQMAVGEEWQALASAFANAVYNYIFRRSIGTEGRRWLWLGLAAARSTGQRGRERLFTSELGTWYQNRGYLQECLPYHEQSLTISREREDQQNEATTLNNIGMVYSDLGDKAAALRYLEQTLPIQRAVGDRAGEATTLNNIGMVYDDLGDKAAALRYYEQALPIRRAVEDRAGEAVTLINIGGAYSDLGDKAQALSYYEQALPLCRAVGDRAGEAATLNNIGSVYWSTGDQMAALTYYEQALPLRRSVGDRVGEAITSFNIGTVYYQMGDLENAIKYEEMSIPLFEQVNHPKLEYLKSQVEQLKRKRDGIPEPDPQEQFMQLILNAYQAGGWDRVRMLLAQQGATLEQINQIIEQLKAAGLS